MVGVPKNDMKTFLIYFLQVKFTQNKFEGENLNSLN
jgi:hypothetical protein